MNNLLKSIVLIFFSLSLFAQGPFTDTNTLNRIEKKYKIFGKRRFLYLQKTLDKLKNVDTFHKLDGVNKFFNDVRYASDMRVYHLQDYWATPWEFLGKDMGDCEDYVISKYFTLIHLGIDPKKLFFTYVKSTRFKSAHMVLTYFKTPRSEPLVLDNTNFKVFPASKRKDLIPVYNFSGATLYRASKRGPGRKVNNKKVHKKWDELQLHMKRKKI